MSDDVLPQFVLEAAEKTMREMNDAMSPRLQLEALTRGLAKMYRLGGREAFEDFQKQIDRRTHKRLPMVRERKMK